MQYILTIDDSPISERFDSFEDAFDALEDSDESGFIKVVAADGFTTVAVYRLILNNDGDLAITMKRA